MDMLRVHVLLLISSSLAFAQLDSLAVRAKVGAPLHRETFHVAAGFDMTVDYTLGGRVCKLEVPAIMPVDDNAKVSNDVVQKQKMYDFLAEIVPPAMRGLKGRAMISTTGLILISFTEYENVAIREIQTGANPYTKDNTIAVTFKNEPCDR
jgi:hypothetical protein